jgi:hypothetical protein
VSDIHDVEAPVARSSIEKRLTPRRLREIRREIGDYARKISPPPRPFFSYMTSLIYLSGAGTVMPIGTVMPMSSSVQIQQTIRNPLGGP